MTTELVTFVALNPWCDMQFLAAHFKRPAGEVRQELADARWVERINLAKRVTDDQRAWSTRYALTADGVFQTEGQHVRPEFLLDALAMSYGRLVKARAILSRLAHSGVEMSWIITPWRPSHAGKYLDGLCGIRTRTGGDLLLFYFRPPALAPLDYSLDVVRNWVAYRQRNPGPLAALVIDLPAMGQLAHRLHELSRVVTRETGPVAIRESGSDILDPIAKWVYVESRDISRPISKPPWDVVRPPNNARLLPGAFLPDRVKHRKALSLTSWMQAAQSPAANLGLAFTALRENELQALEGLCKFPSADSETLAIITGKRPREIRSCFMTLAGQDLAQALPTAPEHWLATERGLALLAAWHGLSAADAKQFLAFPTYEPSYGYMLAHNRIVLGIGVAFLKAGLLDRWSMDNAAQVFQDRGGRRRTVIKPDSHFILRSQGRRFHFWLEVDRGNRRGERLSWTLEKYFRIRLATRSDVRAIPPVLYVVATGNKKRDRQHLGLVRRKLEALALRYPSSQAVLLLATGEWLADGNTDPGNAPVWHTFRAGRYDADTKSLHHVIAQAMKAGRG